jgi:hypothetical protein
MASLEECLATVAELADRLGAVDEHVRKANTPDRTLSLHLTDLDEDIHGRLHEGLLTDFAAGADPSAQLKGSISSDDLVGLADRSLSLPDAILGGRLKISASWRDLLELRRFV